MSLFFLLPAGAPGGIVNLAGEIISTIDSPVTDLIAGIEIRTDGTLYSLTGDTGVGGPDFAQVDASTDWIIPNSASTSRTFHVRMTKTGGSGADTLNGGSSALSSWIELDDTKSWYLEGSTNATWDGDLDISDDGGSTILDTGSYSLAISSIP